MTVRNYPQGSSKCCRWFITFDDSPCDNPAAIEMQDYALDAKDLLLGMDCKEQLLQCEISGVITKSIQVPRIQQWELTPSCEKRVGWLATNQSKNVHSQIQSDQMLILDKGIQHRPPCHAESGLYIRLTLLLLIEFITSWSLLVTVVAGFLHITLYVKSFQKNYHRLVCTNCRQVRIQCE